MTNSFDTFWCAYDKKVGIDKCQPKWFRLSAKDQTLIMNHVHGFVASHRNKQYRPNPFTYLNQKMWLDEGVNETDTLVYKMPKQPTLSDYQAKPFDRAEFIATLRVKIRAYYESGKPLNDYGGAVTSFLTERLSMTIPTHVKDDIERDCLQEKERPRNRFEDVYKGNLDSDIRNMCLRWWLNDQKTKGVLIYEKI